MRKSQAPVLSEQRRRRSLHCRMLVLNYLIVPFAVFIFNLWMRATGLSGKIVDLGYLKYEGVLNGVTGNTEFLGIRFAAPPTGNLRWREPQPPSPTRGIQRADVLPNACFQATAGMAPASPFRTSNTTIQMLRSAAGLEQRDGLLESEDCLFLNVYAPGAMDKKSLPVVVWIHGGGYVAGSASGFQGTDVFDGNDLIREASGGVVAVTIQYRLGLFGFLPGAKVKAEGALNVGLLDQQFALRWVQQHISKFGGDPGKVTIWGVSAGAGSVLQHVIANDGKTTPSLFKGAITSSSFLPSQYRFDDPIPEQLYNMAVAHTSCSTAQDSLSCLRNVDIGVLQAANTDISSNGFFGTFVFVPVVDGTFITQRPTQSFNENKVNGQVFMAFTNTFEGENFVNPSTASTVQVPEYVSQLFPQLGSQEIDATVALYEGLGTPIFDAAAIMGEAIFVCPTYFMLRAFDGRSFKGEFAIPPGSHGNDVAYYFPSTHNVDGIPPYSNTAFDNAFSQSFLNFVMALDPNVKSDPSNITPAWNMWNGRVEMLFNRTEMGEPIVLPMSTSDALMERCEFWHGVGTLTGQ